MGVLDEFAAPSVAINRLLQLASWEPEGLLGFPNLPLAVELGTAYRNLCLQVRKKIYLYYVSFVFYMIISMVALRNNGLE